MAQEVDESNKDEAGELIREILTHGLTMSEHIDELVENYYGEAVEDLFIENVDTMLSNSDAPMRQKRICMLCVNLGNQLQSDRVLAHGEARLKEWEQEYGE